MKHRLAALLAACATACNVSAASTPDSGPAFHILRDDDVYHGGEAPLEPGPGWFALDVVDGRWRLVPARLRGEQAVDPVGDSNTGVRVAADPAHAFLYLQLPGLVAGKVDTPDLRFKDNGRPISDATALAMPFKGQPWRLDVRHHALLLSDGKTTMSHGQVVLPDSPDDGLTLLWAGDLDRDGRLDLIFEGSGMNSTNVCVWLSSRAKPGRLVGQAACWLTTGC